MTALRSAICRVIGHRYGPVTTCVDERNRTYELSRCRVCRAWRVVWK